MSSSMKARGADKIFIFGVNIYIHTLFYLHNVFT